MFKFKQKMRLPSTYFGFLSEGPSWRSVVSKFSRGSLLALPLHYGYFKPWAAFWQKINAQEIIFWCWKFSTKKYVNKICNIWKNFPSAQIFCQKALNSRKNSRNLIFNPQSLEAVQVLKGNTYLNETCGMQSLECYKPVKVNFGNF